MSRLSGIVSAIGELNVVFRSTLDAKVVFVECSGKATSYAVAKDVVVPSTIILASGMITCIRWNWMMLISGLLVKCIGWKIYLW
jgi:hypothetical protein